MAKGREWGGGGHSPWHSDLCRTLVVPGLVISWEPVTGVLGTLFSLFDSIAVSTRRKMGGRLKMFLR